MATKHAQAVAFLLAHRLSHAGVCTGSPLFVRDTSLGSSLSLRGSKCVLTTTGQPAAPLRALSLGSSCRTHLTPAPSRWAASTSTVEGVSLFDVRGAVKLMDGSSSPLPPQRALPSSTDAVLEVGKLRLRLLPELTPSRALFWGSLLCVWTVAGLTTRTARSLGISSAEDVRAKCGEAMEPYARSFQDMLLPIRERLQTGQGAPRVSELTTRLKASMR